MSTTDKLPLLIRGVEGALTSVAAGSSATLSTEKILSGRGNMILCDVMSNVTRGNQVGATINVQLGGKTVLINTMMQHVFEAWPRCYRLTPVVQHGGQQINIILDNVGGAGTNGMTFHMYHENQFAESGPIMDEWNRKMYNPFLNIHTQDILTQVVAGSKTGTSGTLAIPDDRGDVIGIQLIVDTNSDANVLRTLLSVSVGGIKIFDNVNAGLGLPLQTRPNTIFPIFIPGGESIEIGVDTSNSAVAIRAGVRLYFGGKK